VQAKSDQARGDYTVAQWIGGQVKILGLWVNLPEAANVSKVGLQITDKEGENFIYTVDANWTGWKWTEADLGGGSFVSAPNQQGKNGQIDAPVTSVHVVWLPRKAGASTIVVDGLLAVSDMGGNAPANPLSVSLPTDVTLETGGKLGAQVVLTNLSDKLLPAEVEFSVQRDPAMYGKPAPNPIYGNDICPGTTSWYEIGGKTYKDSSMTDGKAWTSPGTDVGGKESFVYVDLGKSTHIVHMGYLSGDAKLAWKADFFSSLDGKEYKPIEGVPTVDMHGKWGDFGIDVPKPFDARFIRMRFHNDGQSVNFFRYPSEFHVFSGPTDDLFALPQVGETLMKGQLAQQIPARSFAPISIGDGRELSPGGYLVAVRTRAGGVNQLTYGHIYIMPPAMATVTRDSRFGVNGIEFPELARRQGNGWVRFENLKWPFVSVKPGVYSFDGSISPHQKYDDLFRSYKEAGLSTMPYLFLTPSYLVPAGVTKGGGSYPPTDFTKFGEFAFQVTARYGSKKHPPEALLTEDKVSGLGYVDTFELWNEADLNDPGWGSWRGPFNDFFVMYRYGAEAVKKADPDAKVANGGWSGMDVPLMERMRNYKYPDGKCPLDFTDVLSVHYYSGRTAPELATRNENFQRDGLPVQVRSFEKDLDALVAWRDKVKPTMPIWMSETGYDTGGPKGVDERLQASWLPRDIMMILASGIDKVQVFRETGSGNDLFSASGMIRNDKSFKPSWFTYATMVRQLDGVTQRAMKAPFEDSNVRVYVWKRGEKSIVTAWAISGQARLNVRLGRCTVTDAFGNSQTTDVSQGLDLTDFPLYITDFADPAGVNALVAQAKQAADRDRRLIERQAKLQTYLFKFGRPDNAPMMTLGADRTFTMVQAADRYDPAKGYGFETAGLKDAPEKWHKSPLLNDGVKVTSGSRFTFNAKPGEYVVSVGTRQQGNSEVLIKGIEGDVQTLKGADDRQAVKTTIKVGTKPVTLESEFNGSLVWMTMVQVDREGDQ
jgi:hypothetical protein